MNLIVGQHQLTAGCVQAHSVTYFGLSGIKFAVFPTNLKLRCIVIVNIPFKYGSYECSSRKWAKWWKRGPEGRETDCRQEQKARHLLGTYHRGERESKEDLAEADLSHHLPLW